MVEAEISLCSLSDPLCLCGAKPRKKIYHRGTEASQRPERQILAATQINITVALDGSGQFKSVQEAIMSVPAGSPAKPVIIHIKPGTYKELIYIQHEKRFFRLVGEDAE